MKSNFCCSHDVDETAQLTFYKVHINFIALLYVLKWKQVQFTDYSCLIL